MKKRLTLYFALAFVIAFLPSMTSPANLRMDGLAQNSAQNLSQYSPAGTWNYEAQTPDGTLKDVMTITLNAEGVYEVSIKSQIYGTLVLDDVVFEKMVMTGNVEIEGETIEFEMKFDGESMEGIVYTGEDELVIKAERQK
ncbi:MAG: hypothetical protein ACI9Z3_000920 [Roseivirga sp.]|jgi:hypothetical protein